MKRSLMAMIVAIFFGVAGLVVLQHSEYAPIMAANNDASNDVVYSINCPAYHSFQTPTNVDFEIGRTLNSGTGGLDVSLVFMQVTGGIGPDASTPFVPGTDADLDDILIVGANLPIEFIHPVMIADAMCLGDTYNRGELHAVAGDLDPQFMYYANSNWSAAFASGTDLGLSDATVIKPATLNIDARSFRYGRSQDNALSAALDANTGVGGANSQSVTVTWTNTVVLD